MLTSPRTIEAVVGTAAPLPSELLQPLIHIWPAGQRDEVAAIADYLYRVASEQPKIIAMIAPLRDASAAGNVRAAAIHQPALFAEEFAAMRRIVLEAISTQGSGDWGRTYLIMNFPALLLQRVELRLRPIKPQPISPFAYAMQ